MDIKIRLKNIDNYRELFEALPMHVFWKDVNHIYLGANSKYIISNNFVKDEFIGKSDYELFDKNFADQFVRGDQIALTGVVYEDKPEPNLNNLDGRRIFKAIKVPLYDEEDNVVGILGLVQDLTVEESEVINALNTGYYKLQKEILDTMTSSVLVIDPRDYTILFANKNAEKLFKINKEGMINRKCHMALANREKPCEWCKLFDEKSQKEYMETRIYSQDKFVKLHVEKITWNGREALIRYDEDITDIKKAAEEMSRVRQESEMKNKFLANMSHDIRTPLNAVLGLAELGLEADNAEDKDDIIKKILSSGKYLSKILSDILDMTKIAAGEIKIEETKVYVPKFEKELITILKAQADSKNINLNFQFSEEHDYLLFDKNHVMQILINLLNNAIKYTKEGGTVTFRNKFEIDEYGRSYCNCTIADNGIGISEDFIEKMYVPFERDTRVDKGNYEGTGLGLSIVRFLLDAMNGSIKCKSKEGEGTEFAVRVPVKIIDEKNQNEYDSQNKVAYEKALEGLNVLVVEDIDINAYVVTKLLSSKNINSEVVKNGKEAIDFMESDKKDLIDVILMDIKMPVLDGLKATKILRGKGIKIPIIGLSANAFEEDIRASEEAGMDAYLSKPINIDELISKLKELV
jgi:signal transduction histidine kinase